MTKTIELNMWERLLAAGVLPGEDNLVTLRLIRKMKERLSPSPEEIDRCKMVPNEDGRGLKTWDNPEMLKTVELEFHEKEVELVKKAIEKLDSQKKCLDPHIEVYEKFVGEEDGNTNTES